MEIGKLIRERLELQQHTVVWLSEQLACSRTNVYKIFEKDHLDTRLLLRLCFILDYDFFKVLSERYREERNQHRRA